MKSVEGGAGKNNAGLHRYLWLTILIPISV